MLDSLRAKIRDIIDFPKAGIIFKDITPLLEDPHTFNLAINLLADRYIGMPVDRVVGVEARGFILGAALAFKLNSGFVPVRKPGKLPAQTLRAGYALEYGSDELEIHCDALLPGSRVLLVDDLIATGGTIAAVINLMHKLQCEVVEIACLIELSLLNGRQRLEGHRVFSLLQY
jgi:adenine phosphoribosyltransferase